MSKSGAEGGADTGSVVSDPQHSQKLLRALQSFRQEGSFQDAVLVLEGEEIPVQKNILAAASPYVRYQNMSRLHASVLCFRRDVAPPGKSLSFLCKSPDT